MYEQARAARIYDGPDEVHRMVVEPPDPEGVPRTVARSRSIEPLGNAPPRPSPSRFATIQPSSGSIAAASSSGLKPFGPGAPWKATSAVAADQVEPVGPAAVGECDRVVDVVEQDRDPRLQAYGARPGRLRPLVERGRIDDCDLLRRLSASTQPSSGCASRM